jgi:acetylornithine deacetylase/succinyl-diaminopimelate desuccinylase-like protein
MEENIKNEYFELLRFESVGADPLKLRDCVNCAMWLGKWLENEGFSKELISPPVKDGKAFPPILFAERRGDEGAPTVLLYGHYDVQPADPITEWNTPPFEPVVKDGRVYCRGAQDDKGQTFAFLCGMKDYLSSRKAGEGVNIKILLEGQEESGSGALTSIAYEIRKRIAADVLLVCDTSAAPNLRPAIEAGMRGVAHFTINLKGSARDLHSGLYGGIAPNAAQAIAELVSSLHDCDGRVAVEGFYDGIEKPEEKEIEYARSVFPADEDIEQDIGCKALGGERALAAVERLSFEPTLEVNGIHSGYGGPGSKTVIPASAVAKISMRLVPGQNPTKTMQSVIKHLESHVPAGMTLSLEGVHEGVSGFRLPLSSPVFRLAADVLSEMDSRGPVFQWSGASIPVVSVLKDATGAAPLLVGWGQSEDCIHSPNESYSFEQFDKARTWGLKILEALG